MNAKGNNGEPVNRASGNASMDPGETIAAGDLAHDGPVAASSAHAKICCVCGADVAEERRYKDSHGRYWCCDCAKKKDVEPKEKESANCADCGQAFAVGELVEHEGARLCAGCVAKRQAAAKRAASRVAAAVEEGRRQSMRHRIMLVVVGVTVVLVVVWAVIRFIGG